MNALVLALGAAGVAGLSSLVAMLQERKARHSTVRPTATDLVQALHKEVERIGRYPDDDAALTELELRLADVRRAADNLDARHGVSVQHP